MLLRMKKNSFVLKEISSNWLKVLNVSKSFHASAVKTAEKIRESSEFEDESFDRREYRAPRKFRSGFADESFDRREYRAPRKFGSESEDESFDRREYRAPRKFGSGSPYSNGRFNQRFQYQKKMQFKSNWENKIHKENYGPISASEVETTPVPTEKFFYVEHPDVTNRSNDEVESYRINMNISTNGVNVPKPITKFSELCLPEGLMKVLNEENYAEPTPIQAQGWPIALSGRDMIGVSQTGSGKTLAYMLPAIIHAANQNHNKAQRSICKPQILVLGPTRELIQQIHQVSDKFIQASDLSSASVYGGASKHHQLCCLEGAEICIATPGRLIDFLSGREVSLQDCSYLVLDEADRMLDMGFEPQIREIVDQIRCDRQTLMWSATWPHEIRNLAYDFLSDFIHVTVGSGDLAANPNIEQKIYVLTEDEKEQKLFSLLKDLVVEGQSKVLVFAQTKRKVDYLSSMLSRRRIQASGIHGDISQYGRDKILNSFRRNKSCALIATDVAARGLDISDIHHVVNYDFPLNIEDYIHRIGRTARGSSSGVAHSFFTIDNAGLLKDIFSVLKKANQPINPELYSLAEVNEKAFMKFNNNKFHRRFFR